MPFSPKSGKCVNSVTIIIIIIVIISIVVIIVIIIVVGIVIVIIIIMIIITNGSLFCTPCARDEKSRPLFQQIGCISHFLSQK